MVILKPVTEQDEPGVMVWLGRSPLQCRIISCAQQNAMVGLGYSLSSVLNSRCREFKIYSVEDILGNDRIGCLLYDGEVG